MDEVLAALRCGRTPLQKVEVTTPAPPCTSINEHILAAIRQGVKLKKVHPDLGPGPGPGPSRKPASDLERSIKAALQRIQRVSADSEEEEEDEGEEEEEEDSPGEWDH